MEEALFPAFFLLFVLCETTYVEKGYPNNCSRGEYEKDGKIAHRH